MRLLRVYDTAGNYQEPASLEGNSMKLNSPVRVFAALLVLVLALALIAGCAPSARSARNAAETLLTYEKFNQWDKVWEMMHPDSQAAWESRSTFLNEFPQATSNLKSFEMGKAKKLSSWTLPGTESTYNEVAEIPVTLVYSTTSGEVERSSIMHPVYYEGQWRFFRNPAR